MQQKIGSISPPVWLSERAMNTTTTNIVQNDIRQTVFKQEKKNTTNHCIVEGKINQKKVQDIFDTLMIAKNGINNHIPIWHFDGQKHFDTTNYNGSATQSVRTQHLEYKYTPPAYQLTNTMIDKNQSIGILPLLVSSKNTNNF